MSKFQRLFSLIKLADPGKGLLSVIATLSIIGASSSLLFPVLTQKLVDSFSQAASIPTNWILIIAAVLIAGTIASGINYYLIGKVANRMLINLRANVLRKAIHLPVKYFDDNQSSEPASRIVNDTEVINSVVAEHFEPFISGMLTMIFSLVILWVLDWQLTTVLFATLFLSFLVTIPVAAKLTKLSKSIQEQEASFLSFITERLTQIRLIKSSNAEKESLDKSQQSLNSLYSLGLKSVRIGAIMAPISGITIVSTLIAILGFGAARVSEGAITIGTLMAFILYLFNIVFPLIQFTYFIAALNKAAGAADRVDELLNEEDEQLENSENEFIKGSNLLSATGKIEIQDLTFGYSDNKRQFNSLNLTIPANQTLALVGESGSGKSTLFSLLLRYYSPESGSIKYDGQSITDFSLTSWRNQIAFISQDIPILSGSIRDNLILGLAEKPTDDRILESIENAQLSTFLNSLPDGLDSQVGERGVKLSGGQRQRLAIARAMLQDCPILVCDEATSNLDSATEQQIQIAMAKLSENRTTIIAAHRLSTVRDSDQIVVLKSGVILGKGTHDALYQTLPYYQELVDLQFSHQSNLIDESENISRSEAENTLDLPL